MKKTTIVLIIFSFVLILSGCDGIGEEKQNDGVAPPLPSSSQAVAPDSPMTSAIQKADKIEVVHFHGVNQCFSCITVGKFALKTIQERFPKEYKNGTIVFRDINGELPENQDIVIKYQARGSSLFVNAITDEQENMQEDVRVWRLVNDEQAFMDYFEGKLKELLG